MARPRKPPKQKVKISDLLKYIENLAQDDPIRQHMTPDRMIRWKRYVEELEYLEFIIHGLKEDIAEHGSIELYVNGAQQTRRTNPALTTYSDLLKVYNQFFRMLSEINHCVEIQIEKSW
ncbi:MAG TPA: hypothetical protein VFC84_01995 [Desulfosporosinus sp.]|nr:hypothetical protein [Desulfosporosinus sp.]